MLQSAVPLKALPDLDEMPSWLPVDIVADAILDLTEINQVAGLEFGVLPKRQWVQRLG